MDFVIIDREGFLGTSSWILASIINFLLDVVLNLQDVCLPMATFLLRRFYFYTAPHHLSFYTRQKKL